MNRTVHAAMVGALVWASPWVYAQSQDTATTAPAEPATAAAAPQAKPPSPWMLLPLLSSGPKLGTAFGGMVGYVWRMDDVSPPSMLGLQLKRSNTESTVAGLGGKLYFNQGRDRLFFGMANGQVHNDYPDFNGTGQTVRDKETLHAFFARYLHQVAPNWYLGGQAVRSNYDVQGEDDASAATLDEMGIVGSTAAGLGLALLYDSRDNPSNPSQGSMFQLSNVAYRSGLGGDNSYDSYTAELRWFTRTHTRNVVALRLRGQWTQDAPASRQASIGMRAYTRGQYLGRNALSLEAEDRYMFLPRWGGKAFAGVTCLYGDGKNCGGEQLYPMAGFGAFYVIKPEANMVIAAEFAVGKNGNRGFYLRFGQPF